VLPFHEKTCRLVVAHTCTNKQATCPHRCGKLSGSRRDVARFYEKVVQKKRRPRYASGGERGLICSMAKIGFNKNRDENAKILHYGILLSENVSKASFSLRSCLCAYLYLVCSIRMHMSYAKNVPRRQKGTATPKVKLLHISTCSSNSSVGMCVHISIFKLSGNSLETSGNIKLRRVCTEEVS